MPKKEQPKHQQKFTGSYSKRRSTRLSQRKAIQKFTLKISRNLNIPSMVQILMNNSNSEESMESEDRLI